MAAHAENPRLGPCLADEVIVFRAFADKGFRKPKNNPPHKVNHFAYLLRDDDAQNGLSVGLTPWAAVKNLASNFGYCSISVTAIRALGLEVRVDATDASHAYICNLPLQTTSDEARAEATRLAKELARKSLDVVCEPYQPNGEGTNLQA